MLSWRYPVSAERGSQYRSQLSLLQRKERYKGIARCRCHNTARSNHCCNVVVLNWKPLIKSHNTARSNHCCNSRPWKPLPRAAFQARFGKPNDFLLDFSRKLVICTFILLFQPLKLSYSKAFTIWQTPIVLFSFTALKANIAYISQIPHAGTSQVLWVNMFGEH